MDNSFEIFERVQCGDCSYEQFEQWLDAHFGELRNIRDYQNERSLQFCKELEQQIERTKVKELELIALIQQLNGGLVQPG